MAIKLRFGLCQPNHLINAADETGYKYRTQTAKLWTQKIVPNLNEFLSLSQSFISSNSYIKYVCERSIIKNSVMPKEQNNLLLDNIINGITAHKLYLFFLRQSAVNGAYFSNCKASSLQLKLNGKYITPLYAAFPKHVASIFHHILINNGNTGQNLLSQKSFKYGCFCYFHVYTIK